MSSQRRLVEMKVDRDHLTKQIWLWADHRLGGRGVGR